MQQVLDSKEYEKLIVDYSEAFQDDKKNNELGKSAFEDIDNFKKWLAAGGNYTGESKEEAKQFFKDNEYRIQRTTVQTFNVAGLRGTECEGASAIMELKALGIIPPDMTSEQFELRFTSMHKGYENLLPESIDGMVTKELLNEQTRLDSTTSNMYRFASGGMSNGITRANVANLLKKNDWAILTGASKKKYEFTPIVQKSVIGTSKQDGKVFRVTSGLTEKQVKQIQAQLKAGHIVYGTSTVHSRIITDIKIDEKGKVVIQYDDPKEFPPSPNHFFGDVNDLNENDKTFTNFGMMTCK
ncbi:MAG: hypothetical protein KDK39_03065 [Leptospiraceae bacterium]|nr:hypothetical protein [Leptospiraceae bacterium]